MAIGVLLLAESFGYIELLLTSVQRLHKSIHGFRQSIIARWTWVFQQW